MKKLISLTTLTSFALLSTVNANTMEEKDKDKDGKLSIEEFAGDDKKLKKQFKKLDTNNDGSLSAEELKKVSDKKKKKKEKK